MFGGGPINSEWEDIDDNNDDIVADMPAINGMSLSS